MCIPAVRRRVKNNISPHFYGRRKTRWETDRDVCVWGGGDTISSLFSYIFKYLAGYLGLISDSGNRRVENTFSIAIQGVCCKSTHWRPRLWPWPCTEGKVKREARLTLKICQITSPLHCCYVTQWAERDSRGGWFILSYRRHVSTVKCVLPGKIAPDQTQLK